MKSSLLGNDAVYIGKQFSDISEEATAYIFRVVQTTLVTTYQSIKHHFPENLNLHLLGKWYLTFCSNHTFNTKKMDHADLI